ncbi:MAG: hypothetical protein EA369_03390 [Bradymonadales bacterium]|nr:MAG: hypothetical protein EA369_03390 [Bradymonadales bacterium]
MISNLIFAAIVGLTFQADGGCKQLDCEEAVRFSQAAMGSLSQLNSNLVRMRELAIQSSNGAIASRDRGFLNNELEAWLEETFRVINGSNFVDIFQDQHYYLRDGFRFKTPIKIAAGNFAYLQDFSIDALKRDGFGALAVKRFALRRPEISTSETSYILSVNGKDVLSSTSNDAVSLPPYHVFSSVSLAEAVNSVFAMTGVMADVEQTVVELNDVNRDLLRDIREVQPGELLINRVHIFGYFENVSEVITTINNFSFMTGTRARLMSGSADGIVLYAPDGRNIVLEAQGDVAEALNIEDSKQVYNGSIVLTSGRDFDVTFKEGFSILAEFDDRDSLSVSIDPHTGLSAIDISTQSNAQNALAVIDQSITQIQERMIQARLPEMLCK